MNVADRSGSTAGLSLPSECLVQLIMTLPEMASKPLMVRYRDESLRIVYPLGALRMEALDLRKHHNEGRNVMKARLRIRVDFDEGTILSPGKVRLLELIDEFGSLERAAADIRMDCDPARHVIQRLEGLFGGALYVTETRGPNSGRLHLTVLGRNIVQRYYATERISSQAAEHVLAELISLAHDRHHDTGGVT